MKTPTKKKAVKEKLITTFSKGLVKGTGWAVPNNSPYELFQSRNGTWKWRKRAKNRAILNHQYNTKAAAIKGMRADFAVTKAMDGFEFREVKG